MLMPSRQRVSPADTGPQERHQHDKVVSRETGQAGVTAALVVTSGHLNRYYATGLLGTGHIRDLRRDAGHKLGEDYYNSGLQPQIISRMADFVSGGSVEGFAVFKMDAYNRYMKARALIPAGCLGAVHSVCCLDDPAGPETRMEMLRKGLDALASGYGMR